VRHVAARGYTSRRASAVPVVAKGGHGYYEHMDGEYLVQTHRLIVTGPLRDRLYERFADLYSHSVDVEVVKDRRYAERRRVTVLRPDERRHDDRRRLTPEWVFPPEAA
jgi:hypothetical protein